MPKSSWAVILAFGAAIVIVYAVRAYRAARKPQGGDALVLVQLREAGADLSEAHSLEFVLYLPTQEAAQNAAELVRSRGFIPTVEAVAGSSNWLCLATKSMVPTLTAIEGIRADFVKIAQSLGGEYDGWNASY